MLVRKEHFSADARSAKIDAAFGNTSRCHRTSFFTCRHQLHMMQERGPMSQQDSWQGRMPLSYQVHQKRMRYGSCPGKGSHSRSTQTVPFLPQHGIIGQGSFPTLDLQSMISTQYIESLTQFVTWYKRCSLPELLSFYSLSWCHKLCTQINALHRSVHALRHPS
jgi:hypothetical protein